LFVADAYSLIQQAAMNKLAESELQKQFNSISQQLLNADNLYSSIWDTYRKQYEAAKNSLEELGNQFKASQADLEHYRGLSSALKSQHDELLEKVESLATKVGEGAEIIAANSLAAERASQLEKINQDLLIKIEADEKEKDARIESLERKCQEVSEQLVRRDTELASEKNLAIERDEQIKELTNETVKRGEWGIELDRQLKQTHDQIAQITSSPSWMITFPLRELRRWLDHPVLQTKRYLRFTFKQSKRVYERIPLTHSTKARHKQFIVKHAPWALHKCNHPAISVLDVPVQNQADMTAIDCQSEADRICLNTTTEPVVSVIIPVYGKCEYTIRCLATIAQNSPSTSFEVIVVDDFSPDNTVEVLSGVEGLRLIKNGENLGFIRTCNHGADEAKGQYLLFLNNDTAVLPGWLDELKRTFDDNEKVGLVGSKLLYPDGILQEAGGIIWRDGSGWNFGRNDDPGKPEYNYLRDVDYCSGASIMVPAKLFFEAGRFDERYIPAYYEDTDLAFSLRESGYRVMYQPLSRIVHYEGVSSGTDLNSGVKKYQVDNGEKFYEKWKHILAGHRENGDTPDHEKERNVEKRILIIDAVTPTPDKDSGSVDIQSYFTILLSLGYKITFIPADNFQNVEGYTQSLQRQGIECLYLPYEREVLSHLKERGRDYNIVMLYRADYASLYIDDVKKYCPNALTIFNTVDLHFLRMQRQAKIEGDESLRKEADRYKEMELSLMAKADKTIILSNAELRLLLDEGIENEKLFIVPLIREIPGRNNDFNKRKDIVFVGGFQHTPNVDAILYFCNEIWPLVRKKLASVKLYIIGSNMPDSIIQLEIPGVCPVGFVEDLSDYFDSSRLSVAPLRYGAGLKGKVGASLAYGLPCVATSTAVEGSGLIDKQQVLVADDPEKFSDAVCELYSNNELWQSLSDKGLKFVNSEYSLETGKSRITDVLS
jgi:GT2 family glycosyltransferase